MSWLVGMALRRLGVAVALGRCWGCGRSDPGRLIRAARHSIFSVFLSESLKEKDFTRFCSISVLLTTLPFLFISIFTFQRDVFSFKKVFEGMGGKRISFIWPQSHLHNAVDWLLMLYTVHTL